MGPSSKYASNENTLKPPMTAQNNSSMNNVNSSKSLTLQQQKTSASSSHLKKTDNSKVNMDKKKS